MTNDPTQSPQKSSEDDKVSLENKNNLMIGYVILGLIGCGLLGFIGFVIVALTSDTAEEGSTQVDGTTQASPSTAVKKQESISTPTTTETSSERIYLGTSPTGYELWADNKCVYVKGITEGDLARLGTDVWAFKKAVKAETGYSCVLYE